MKSQEYKEIISKISFNLLKKTCPDLDKKIMTEVSHQIAVNVHARMYGANVDGVESPIWGESNPTVDAKELLK